jgi:integrase
MVAAGHLEHSPAATLDPVRVPRRLPRPASEAQVTAGTGAACPDTALMVALAAHAGLRRSEIAALRRQDVTPWGVHVVGKGGRHRVVPLAPALREQLEARSPGWIFPGRFTGHLHPATVQKRVRAAAGVAPHAHRHRFATRAYAGTRDLLAVQQLLGHQSPETTQVYVAVAGLGLLDAVRAAA